jgi:hypothetical protein
VTSLVGADRYPDITHEMDRRTTLVDTLRVTVLVDSESTHIVKHVMSSEAPHRVGRLQATSLHDGRLYRETRQMDVCENNNPAFADVPQRDSGACSLLELSPSTLMSYAEM